MKRILLVAAALALSGCVTAQGRWITAEDADGIMRRVLHIDAPCPQAIDVRGGATGCYYNGPVVWAGGAGESLEDAAGTMEHELEHHKGMRHLAWQQRGADKCAKIIASGRTQWREGWLLCRGSRGYYQVNPAQPRR